MLTNPADLPECLRDLPEGLRVHRYEDFLNHRYVFDLIRDDGTRLELGSLSAVALITADDVSIDLPSAIEAMAAIPIKIPPPNFRSVS